MDEKLELVHEHMISLGGDVLAHANWLAGASAIKCWWLPRNLLVC